MRYCFTFHQNLILKLLVSCKSSYYTKSVSKALQPKQVQCNWFFPLTVCYFQGLRSREVMFLLISTVSYGYEDFIFTSGFFLNSNINSLILLQYVVFSIVCQYSVLYSMQYVVLTENLESTHSERKKFSDVISQRPPNLPNRNLPNPSNRERVIRDPNNAQQ